MIKSEESYDSLNLQDDHPKIMFGPWAQTLDKYEDVPPFYINLRIHDIFLHNAMFDSSVSHNLMPKIIMDILGIDITRPYKDLYSFDSRELKCLGLIKDLVVALHETPEKNIVMDVVATNVTPKFGMMLSISWAAKLKGTLQMDLSYATIPVFGEQRGLYRDNCLAYMISNKENPEDHPIYFVDTDMVSSMLFNDSCPQKSKPRTSENVSDEEN